MKKLRIPLLGEHTDFDLIQIQKNIYVLKTKDDYYELGDLLDVWYKTNIRLSEKRYKKYIGDELSNSINIGKFELSRTDTNQLEKNLDVNYINELKCDLENLKETQFKDFDNSPYKTSQNSLNINSTAKNIHNQSLNQTIENLDNLKETQFKDFDSINEGFVTNEQINPIIINDTSMTSLCDMKQGKNEKPLEIDTKDCFMRKKSGNIEYSTNSPLKKSSDDKILDKLSIEKLSLEAKFEPEIDNVSLVNDNPLSKPN